MKHEAFPKLGVLFGGHQNKDYSILRGSISIFGSRYLGRLPHVSYHFWNDFMNIACSITPNKRSRVLFWFWV